MTPLALCALLGASTWPAPDAVPLSPADAVRVAAADARLVARVDPQRVRKTRYLAAQHLSAAERAELNQVDGYHVNGISREPVIVRPRRVTDWLWALDIRDYAWKSETFGALTFGTGAFEPYFHVRAIGTDGKTPVPAGAFWVANQDLADLAALTGSQTPIVRADWFLHRTAIQQGRGESGYLDFLQIPHRKDAEKLAGLDRARAEEIFRELGAVVEESGVATARSRQLFRYGTTSGGWWETRDTNADFAMRDRRNPLRNLRGDYLHDAEEIVFSLPNRLPGYFLSDAKGVGANFAPPEIAADDRSRSMDKRVHVGLSCIRCHTAGGLKPFDDMMRRHFAGDRIRAVDDKLQRTLRSVYLGPIERDYKRDRDDFADAIERASGFTAEGLAAAYARQWSRYIDEPVDVARAAAECGVTEADFLRRVRIYAKREGVTDFVLLRLIDQEPRTVGREQFEELFVLLMKALRDVP